MRLYQIEIEYVVKGDRWDLFTYNVAATTLQSALKKAYARAGKDAGSVPGTLNCMSTVWLNRATYIA